jgi:ADP-heptose:LPS heptosyltransferase
MHSQSSLQCEAAADSTGGSDEWSGLRHVLAVRLDNLGDLLMTAPALAALREARPGLRITLLSSPAGKALAPHLPAVDSAIAFEAPWVQSAAPAWPDGAEAALAARLAALRFDAAIIFTVCTQSALPAAMLCRLAGIPKVLAHSRENPYRLISHWQREPDTEVAHARHEVLRQLSLLRGAGLIRPPAQPLRQDLPPAQEVPIGAALPEQALQQLPPSRQLLRIDEADRRVLRQRLSALGLAPGAGYFVVHPGASAASRRYPTQRFGAAAAAIAAGSGLRPVFIAGKGEGALVREARAAAASFGCQALALGEGTVPPAGELGQGDELLPLGQLMALIEGAALVLCNNSGPSHIAAALRRPLVVLYALTNPQHQPWSTRSRVLYQEVPCRNCLRSVCPAGHHECLLGVSVQQVSSAALALLNETGPVPASAPVPANAGQAMAQTA